MLDILKEIEKDSLLLKEELELFSERVDEEDLSESFSSYYDVEDILSEEIKEKGNINFNAKDNLKQKLIDRGNDIVKKMKEEVSEEEYYTQGFQYRSKMLYTMSLKYPFLSSIVAPPLIALTKMITNNAISRNLEREKILKVYGTFKGNKAAVDGKISELEKMDKLNKEQKEELITLKKMSAELAFNLKRLEANYKLTHAEEQQERNNDD